ncbi:hypothetical protein KBK19_16585 [Microvirga sp. STR05]|uniref:RES domain-containing protein n=1 Tax=Hymenobacter duratus TaxID=2771356 RepID=A0ABR8JII2_9BACT|nr:hypothetical protein [Hymenobacter duratus]MBD2716663.1 hypothetical protein [Hymenobacter duratus]MBR7951578.1 hypothetical protein [Microvirga sp. STR05]
MSYFHHTLLSFGFTQIREGFYTRPVGPKAGGTLYCSTQEDDRPRKLLLWQPQRVLLQGDVVTLQALEQVLRRVLGPEAHTQDPGLSV